MMIRNRRQSNGHRSTWLRTAATVLLVLTLTPALVMTLAPLGASAAGNIFIRKHNCPADYIFTTQTIYDLAADCQEAGAGVTFTITVANVQPVVSTTDGNGWISGQLPDVGDMTIEESVPQGYQSLAFCQVSSSLTGEDVTPRAFYDNPISVTLFDDQLFDCDVFDVPVYQPASLLVNTIVCPSGFDMFAADIYGLAQGCNANAPAGVAFTLTPNGGAPLPGQTDGTGKVSWSPVTPGVATLAQALPAGYAASRVFCKETESNGTETGELEFQVTDNNILINPSSGGSFYCDWFNGDATPSTVTIVINKHGCPQGFDAAANQAKSGLNPLFAACLETQTGITFDVSGAAYGSAGGQGTGDVVPGGVRFSGLPADTWTISEQVPSGYGDPIVACQASVSGQSQPGPAFVPNQVNGDPGAIVVDLTGGQTLTCEWFNVWSTGGSTTTPPVAPTASGGGGATVPPPSGPATLKVLLYTCAEGYDPLAPDADPRADCPDTTDGATFRLVDDADETIKEVTGGDEPGRAVFSNLDPGAYRLVEQRPHTVTSSFIRACKSDVRAVETQPLTPYAYIGAKGTIGVTLLPGETLSCAWYDIPAKQSQSATPTAAVAGAHGVVSLTVLDCPGSSVNRATCAPAGDGVAFSLTPVGGTGVAAQLTTDEDGIAEGDVGVGTYALTQVDRDWCFADSDAFDQNGAIPVASGTRIEVTIYDCDGA